MSAGFRQSQATLHTWSGLVVGWVLFAVFLMGTVSYWKDETNRWTRPELGRIEDRAKVVSGAVAALTARAGDADSWYIGVPDARSAGAYLYWEPQVKPGEAPQPYRPGATEMLIGATGQTAVARDTLGGEFFYRFHFDLHYVPAIWARWFVGVCAALMLVAIVSGIITHKKIFKDFFTLRRGKGQRSWLDGHNATAVLALPFHLMITYTGLITLMTLYMPWAAVANYNDSDKLFEAMFPQGGEVQRSGTRVPLVDIMTLVDDAERRWGGAPAGSVQVRFPGDAAARVTVTRSAAAALNARGIGVEYDGATGRMLWQSPPSGPAATTAGAMLGLHMGRFASAVPRWLYFLSGMAGTVMVASGLVLWTVKRREKLPDPARPHFGFRVVERLNIGFIAGVPLAMAAFLWANRLLPFDMIGRSAWEAHCFFIVWLGALACGAIAPTRRTWTGLFAVTGALLIALPLHDMISGEHGLPVALARGDMAMVWFECGLFALGIMFVAIADRVRRHRGASRRTRRAPAAALREAL